jgi:GNAT superfamily N-acetyltransferase
MYYQLLTPPLIDEALRFIKVKEYLCTDLSQKLLTYKKGQQASKDCLFLLLDTNNRICGILCLCSNGRILHFLPFDDFCTEIATITIKLLVDFYGPSSMHTLFCVVGMDTGSEFLGNCAIRAGLKSSLEITDFQLMIFQPQESVDDASILQKKLDGYTLHHCLLTDIDLLDDLNNAYYYEEVLPKYLKCNKFILHKELEKTLQNQTIYALLDANKIAIAKVATNAIGLHWCQLGGVYTDPQFRNQGCASFLVAYIAKKLKRSGYNSVLFVKKENIPAIRVYTKIGFKQKTGFKIIYFK